MENHGGKLTILGATASDGLLTNTLCDIRVSS